MESTFSDLEDGSAEPTWIFDVGFNSSTPRGGKLDYSLEYRRELGKRWSAAIFASLRPEFVRDFHGDHLHPDTFAAILRDAEEHGENPDHFDDHLHDHTARTHYQFGLRLQYDVWRAALGEDGDDSQVSHIVAFGSIAGPSLVSQQGVDLDIGIGGEFWLADDLYLEVETSLQYTSDPLDHHSRSRYASLGAELGYITGWLPNETDRWFINLNADSGDVVDEGIYSQLSVGVGFSLCESVDAVIQVGTDLHSPYEQKSSSFLHTGFSFSF